MDDVARTTVLIVGSGGNGVSAAVSLLRAGIRDIHLISKAEEFGGSWYENRYPGLEVDVPSAVYQFSYEPNPDWDRRFAAQPQLLSYILNVVEKYGLRRYSTLNTELLEARWDEQELEWVVATTGREYRARFLVLATGYLEDSNIPNLPGMSDFSGKVFHSTQWPEGYSGEGERVAVVGTGASAIQIIPSLQKHADHVVSFQRTPTWVLPKSNPTVHPFTRWWLTRSRSLRKWYFWRSVRRMDSEMLALDGLASMEAAKEFLRRQVLDPKLVELLTPDHYLGCKRPLFSDTYLSSLNRPNVTVVPEAAASFGEYSIRSVGGLEFDVDTVVMTTGFNWAGPILSRVHRRDGATVDSVHDGRPRAYKSVNVAGCPNLFLSGGAAPNGQTTSGLFSGEAAARYLVEMIRLMRSRGYAALEVTERAERVWKAWADEILDAGPTVAGGCSNYSQDIAGHNKAAWPGTIESMWDQLGVVDLEAYEIVAPTRQGDVPTHGLAFAQSQTPSRGLESTKG